MAANGEKSDICNVQGIDAEYLLDDMNALLARLKREHMPPIARQELQELIGVWKLVLEESGHQVRFTPNGYEFQRRHTGSL